MKTIAFVFGAWLICLAAVLVSEAVDARPRPRTNPHMQRMADLVMAEYAAAARVGYDEVCVVMLELHACYGDNGIPRPGTGAVYAKLAAHAILNGIDCMRIDAKENQ